jgi:hypothetical protein
MLALALEFGLVPSLEHIDLLEVDLGIVRRRGFLPKSAGSTISSNSRSSE